MAEHETGRSGDDELGERARRVLWPGSQDYCHIDEIASFPQFVTRTEGPYVWDAAGAKYVDLFLGSGPVVLGHDVEAEIQVAPDLDATRSVSLRNHAEVLLAEELQDLIPFLDRVAYFKTGSEALHFTLRQILRESETNTVLTVGYHGWLPPWDGTEPLDAGGTLVEPDDDPESVLRTITDHGENLAAIVLEPTFGFLEAEFHREVERLADRYDIDLVMDEVKSGFRLDFPCSSVEAGIEPEFLILSKAVANGAPLSVVCASRTASEKHDLQGVHSTFAAEAGALVDAYRTVRALEEGAYSEYAAVSSRFYDLLDGSGGDDEPVVEGRPTFFALNPDAVDTTAIAASLLDDGVLLHPHDQMMFSAAHNRPEVISTVESALRNCEELRL